MPLWLQPAGLQPVGIHPCLPFSHLAQQHCLPEGQAPEVLQDSAVLLAKLEVLSAAVARALALAL